MMAALLRFALGLACCVALAGASSPVSAAETMQPLVTIDLNKLEAAANACRFFMVLENKSQSGFTALKLDLVLFGTDGVIAKRLAVDGAPLRAAKTSLKVFDVEGLACEGVGRVLLNDVLACDAETGPVGDCQALVEVSARGPVPFVK